MTERTLNAKPCLCLEHLLEVPETRQYRYRDGNDTHEIYLPHTEGLELGDLLLHCSKVCADLSGLSVPIAEAFCIFPGTLQGPDLTDWQEIYKAIPPGTNLTYDCLKAEMKNLLALYATESDRAALLAHIRTRRKPVKIPCQQLARLQGTLNDMAALLPGPEPVLTQDKLNLAYHTAMPQKWQDAWIQTGRSLHGSNIAELCVFFSSQKRLSNRLQEQNNNRQGRPNNQVCHRKDNNNDGRPSQRARYFFFNRSTSRRTSNRGGSTNNRSNTRRNNNNQGQQNPESMRTPNDAPCPVHRGANHTWGECRQNTQNVRNANNNGNNNGGSNRQPNRQRQNNASKGNAVETDTNNNEKRADNIVEDSSQAGVDDLGKEPIIVDSNVAEVADVPMPDAAPIAHAPVAATSATSSWGSADSSGWAKSVPGSLPPAMAVATAKPAPDAASPAPPTTPSTTESAVPTRRTRCKVYEQPKYKEAGRLEAEANENAVQANSKTPDRSEDSSSPLPFSSHSLDSVWYTTR